MPNFIECLNLWDLQLTILIFGILLKEWPHLPARVQEVIRSTTFAGCKKGDLLGVIVLDKVLHFFFQNLYDIFIVDILEDKVPMLPKVVNCILVQLLFQIFKRRSQIQVSSLALVQGVIVPWETVSKGMPLFACLDMGFVLSLFHM